MVNYKLIMLSVCGILVLGSISATTTSVQLVVVESRSNKCAVQSVEEKVFPAMKTKASLTSE